MNSNYYGVKNIKLILAQITDQVGQGHSMPHLAALPSLGLLVALPGLFEQVIRVRLFIILIEVVLIIIGLEGYELILLGLVVALIQVLIFFEDE